MPKRKDSFICNWLSVTGQTIRERIVLYETVSSLDDVDPDSDAATFNYQKEQRHEQADDLDELDKTVKRRRAMFRGFMAAIYVCLEELAVLKAFCKRPFEPAWNEPLVYKDLEQLYSSFDESHDMFKPDDMRKSLRDTCILFNILGDVFLEMQREEKFSSLENSTDILSRQIQDEECLIQELKYMYKYKEYLKLALVREKTEHKYDFLYICEEAFRSKLIYEDVFGFSRSEYYYNSDWESARLEQKIWSVRKETKALTDATHTFKENISNEQRVHNEIENYCGEYMQDLYQQIGEWQVKYETELERDDSRLIYLRNELEMITIKFADMQILFDTRSKEMADWIEYRTAKEIVDELQKKLTIAAVKIQAWWRGVLYRKQLGPYRKKKKGKGKGGKKGAPAKKK